MTRETKDVTFVDFKALDQGANGGFTAYATVFGELDDVGDIILPGAYQKTIPQFLKRGFIAQGHDWSTAIGMPVGAKEDNTGLLVEARYHSTDQARAARTVTNERRAAGLDVAVSIGYEPSSTPIIVNAADYPSELPKYVRGDLLDSAMQKATRFDHVRVMPEVHLYEISLVQVPALESALVTSSKGISAADLDRVLQDLGTGLEYTVHCKWLGTAIQGLLDRTEARAEMRTKEGRVFSSANMSDLESMASQLEDMATRMRAMMEAAKPKPKQDGTQATDEGKALAQEVNALLLEHYARQPQLRALHIRS